MKNLNASDIFLGVIALLLVGISFYQTWIGLEQIFGGSAIIISFVLSCLLLVLSWKIREAKIESKPVKAFVGLYIVIAFVCFTANFNAIYTRFMTTRIYDNELHALQKSMNDLESKVTAKFNYKYSPEIAQEVQVKQKQLFQQIQDPGNLGLGTQAKGLIQDINAKLGVKIDELTVKDKDYLDLAKRMSSQIDDMMLNLSPQEEELKKEIAALTLQYNKKISEAFKLKKEERKEIAQGLIESGVTDYNKIATKSETVLGSEKFKPELFVSETADVGTMGFAFNDAIKNFGIYTIMVLFGCLLLDFLTPILVWLFTENNGNGGSNNNQPNKNEGKTLTDR